MVDIKEVADFRAYYTEHNKKQEHLEKEALRVLDIMWKAKGKEKFYYDQIDTVEYYVENELEVIQVEYTNYSGCGCCSDDHEYESFPISYLFETELQTILEDEHKERVRIAEEGVRKAEEERVKKHNEQELENYRKLKEKFEKKEATIEKY